MGFIRALVRLSKGLRFLVVLLLVAFWLVFLGGVIYMFLQKTWQDPTTWESGLLKPAFPRFGGIRFESILDGKTGHLEVSADYAVLYKIVKDNKQAKYYFSFTPYSVVVRQLKKMPVASLQKRLSADFIFVLPNLDKYKPSEFLGHRLLTVDSYTSLFASDPEIVPVRFSFKINVQRFLHPSVHELFRHAYVVYIRRQKDVIPEKLIEWKVSKIPSAHEFFKDADNQRYSVFLNKWSQSVFDWYTARVKKTLRKYDITQKEGRVDFFNAMVEVFSSPYHRCSLAKCVKEGEVSPGAPYLLYLYGLYYRDPELFATLKSATYSHFRNYHPDYSEGSREDKWGLIVPYVAPVAPVSLKGREPELNEFFVDTYKILAQRIQKPLLQVRVLSRQRDAVALPRVGWSDQAFTWAVGDSNLAAYYKYVKGNIYLPEGTYKELGKSSQKLLTLLLNNRIIGKAGSSHEGKLFLLGFPKDKKKLAYFVYNGTQFSPYNPPFIQLHRELFVDVNSLDGFETVQDKVLSLLLAYEVSVK